MKLIDALKVIRQAIDSRKKERERKGLEKHYSIIPMAFACWGHK
jgi:hypothetical protein